MPRRVRYSGKNPRKFEDKYKERQPEKYPADVAKVLDSGKTPAGMHRPIMVREILDGLAPQPGEIAVDCTLGYGGHARELLAAVQPGGKLLAVDADPLELARTETRLRELGHPPESLIVRKLNFAGVAKLIAEHAPAGADVLVADLGLSSMQIDDPARGFTFKVDAPLDMRLNPQRGAPASQWLSQVEEAKLSSVLAENSDEPAADALAHAIHAAHARSPLTGTLALARLVRSVYAQATPEETENAVRRVFQAIRIEVNDEFGSLEALLRSLPWCLKPGGRAAFLTFHSGEDRRVKQAFRQGERDGLYRAISQEVIRASSEERRANPRSSSAKLRWAVRGE